jgi:tripartite-type tricarboxylate transporter receptor subunit TctC
LRPQGEVATVAAGGTPEAFAAFIRKEAECWTPVISAAGIRGE